MPPSRQQMVSYAVDWVIILIAIIVALGLSIIPPDSHAFSVLDLSLSYPYQHPKLGIPVFIFLAVIVPVVAVVFVSFTTLAFGRPRGPLTFYTRQQRLWEMNAGLLGLGVSLGTAIVIYTGVKNLTGKPRPNFLEHCQPDLANIAAHTVGGYGQDISPRWVMVDRTICQQQDWYRLNDAFRSFPSGYTTVAFAGLGYLAIWLSARFGAFIPHACPDTRSQSRQQTVGETADEGGERQSSQHDSQLDPASPPVYLLFLPYVPVGLAIFIGCTRYFDFRNHGFDVLAGAAIGSATAWFGFRWYHPPMSDVSRTVWNPRRADSTFHYR